MLLPWLQTEQISVGWSNTTLSDNFIYQFAQLVLEFIDFFMCKFGAPENKFIAMLIIFYFFNFFFFFFALCCFFSSMIITNHVLYQDSVLYYNLCFKEIMQICEKCFFFFCKSVVDI